jgi:plastocyanin
LHPGARSDAVRVTPGLRAAGTYKYFCDIHPGMIGYVVVRAKGKSIPSARHDAATLKSEIKAQGTPAGKLVKTPGTYHYVCLIHPFMHGTIIVK